MHKPYQITFRFLDNSCAREQCINPANTLNGNIYTGYFYCDHCTTMMKSYERGIKSVFFTEEEMKEAEKVTHHLDGQFFKKLKKYWMNVETGEKVKHREINPTPIDRYAFI